MKRSLPAFAAVLCVAALALVSLPVFEREVERAEDPDILFTAARLIPSGERYLLDAQAEIQLPDAVRQGLDSGVPLYFVVELVLAESRSPWPDRRVATHRWHYRLNYYELTRHYRINAIDGGGNSRNYRSLTQALGGLGNVRAEFDVPGSLGEVAIVNMQLDSSRLPLPLRPVLGGWGSSWAIRGEAYRWSFDIGSLGGRA